MDSITIDAIIALSTVSLVTCVAFGIPAVIIGRRNGRGGAIIFVWGILLGPIGWIIVSKLKPIPEPYHVTANRRIEEIRNGKA